MNKLRLILTGAALLFAAWPAVAQQDSVAYNESVVVTGEYNPILDNKLLKMNVAPQITDTNMKLQHDFSYSITPHRLTSIFQPTRIKAAKIIGEPQTRLYNNYFRFGMGYKWTGLLDAFYNSTRDTRLAYGASLQHYNRFGTLGSKNDSVSFSPEYWGAAPYSTTNLRGFAKYIWKNNTELNTSINYQNDYTLFYGFSDSVLHENMGETRDDIKHGDYKSMYNLVEWTAGVKSLNTDVNKFGYEANLLLGHLWGCPVMSEQHLRLDGTMHYGFPMFKKSKGIAALQLVWDHYGQRYGTDALLEDMTLLPLGYAPDALSSLPYMADSNRWNKGVFTVHPYIDFLFKDFKFHVGLRGSYDGYTPTEDYEENFVNDPAAYDTMAAQLTNDKFSLFPDMTVSKNFMSDAMSLSAGFVGDVEANSWNTLRLMNPYIAPNQETRASRHYDVFARMRFDFSKKLSLRLHMQYSWMNDMPAFALDSNYLLDNMYKVHYVDFTELCLGGNFIFLNDEMLQIEVGGNYYNYGAINNTGDHSYLAYRPTWDAHLAAKVNYKNKVYVSLNGMLVSKMTCEYQQLANNAVVADTLPMRYGIGLNVEYIHTRALSFFLNLDNIGCQRYFLWANYPSRRLTAMVGMTYTIPTKKR